MARGNSRAQSELVDRLKAKIANKDIDKKLKERGEAQTREQRDAAYAASYEKNSGETYRPYRSYFDVSQDKEELERMLQSGPLSAMKDSALVKALMAPKVAKVSDEKAQEIAEIAKPPSLDDYLGDNYGFDLTDDTEPNEDGDRPELQDDDGNGYSYDDTTHEVNLPDYFVEKDGKVYQVKQTLTIPIEIDDNVLSSTAKSDADIERSFSVKEVIVRPGEYVKDGRFITTFGGGKEYGSYRPSKESDAEKKSPEYQRARREFESMETQVKQFNSIIKKNPRLNQDARLVFSEKLYNQGTLGSYRSYRFNG